MRPPVNILVAWLLPALLLASLPTVAGAQPPEPVGPEAGKGQLTEDRWVASLAATSGVFLQNQDGSIDACLFANPANATGACPAPGSTPLRPASADSDLAIAAFVGANLEVMSPALPIPTRPRVFLSGEILPTFGEDRNITGEGDPDCVRGPEPGDPCARYEDPNNPRDTAYGQDAANGQGSVVSADYDTLTWAANLGFAFPLRVGDRQLRIKPSFGWLSYKVHASGEVVDATCNPPTRCTNVLNQGPGMLRETILLGSGSERFNAIGPGVDVEMDTGRFGPLGTAIFIGGRAYRTLGDRSVRLSTTEVYPNDGLPLAGQAVSANWDVDVKPWFFRLGVGLRLQWLGSAH